MNRTSRPVFVSRMNRTSRPVFVSRMNRTSRPVFVSRMNRTSRPVFVSRMNRTSRPVFVSRMNRTSRPVFVSRMNRTSRPVFVSRMNRTSRPVFVSRMNRTSRPVFVSRMNRTSRPVFVSRMNRTSRPVFVSRMNRTSRPVFVNRMKPTNRERAGRLVVVGTGIRTVGQLTVEAIAWLKVADYVFYLAADGVAPELIEAWQPGRASSLHRHYCEGRPRREAYDAMVAEIAAAVRTGGTVAAAFYGHPGIFANPSHEVIALLRAEGYRADMLPGISAEDCLFADLGIDPAEGCHSYDATNFLTFDHIADPTVHLVLWQIGMVGDWTHRASRDVSANVGLLVEKLTLHYPLDHEMVLYQASYEPGEPHNERHCTLAELPTVRVTSASTLYVRPAAVRRRDEMFCARLVRIRGDPSEGSDPT